VQLPGHGLEPEIIDSVDTSIRQWGTRLSWSRLLDIDIDIDIEERLTELLTGEDTLVIPTISPIHRSVMPATAGREYNSFDRQSHQSIYDGGTVARCHGDTVQRFPTGDVEALDSLLSGPMACSFGFGHLR
jgi:7-keto-8-aminopelargonate synthetase-like enzyme